jgi:hypothetical protein
MTDVTINPKSLIYNGEVVSDANPLPCSSLASLAAPVADLTLGPVSWIVNGEIVSDANPLPITLV